MLRGISPGRRIWLTVAGTCASLSLCCYLCLAGQPVSRASADGPQAQSTFLPRDTAPSSAHILSLPRIQEIDLQKLDQARVNLEAPAQLKGFMRGRASSVDAAQAKGEGNH